MTMDRYEEALKRAKAELNAGITEGARNVLLTIFPQLKESDGERIRKEIIKIFNVENFEGYNVDNAEAIEGLKKQKPAEWSEEDEKKRSLLISILKVNHPNGYFKVNPANTSNMEAMSTEELVDWLESLKKRVHPQPKQEWCEEDKLVLKQAIYVCHQNGYTAVEDWLKSLKPNHWKPSEEQLRVLQTAIKDYGICHEKYVLESLYNSLKKL